MTARARALSKLSTDPVSQNTLRHFLGSVAVFNLRCGTFYPFSVEYSGFGRLTQQAWVHKSDALTADSPVTLWLTSLVWLVGTRLSIGETKVKYQL